MSDHDTTPMGPVENDPQGSGNSNERRKQNPKKSQKRARGDIEALEKRILLSATWIDADTGETLDDATHADDIFHGTDGRDREDGLGGDDMLHGLGGHDKLAGGSGDDDLFGDNGNDTLFGDDGDDMLDGGAGNDQLRGGTGHDTLWGGDGNDNLRGESGQDTLHGGAGNDRLEGGSGHDRLDGGDGDDQLRGDGGDDELTGGAGRDRLIGNDGHDTLDGGSGDDYLRGDGGDDTLRGGDGNDRLYGNDGHDELSGGAGNDQLDGDDGDDVLDGGAGNDRLRGDDGHDVMSGGDGHDWLDGGDGNDQMTGGDGHDTLRGGRGHDTLVGGEGGDDLRGQQGNDVLDGGAGDDTLHGGSGDDELRSGAGNDHLKGHRDHDTLIGDDGDDVLQGGSGDDKLDGGAGDDNLRGDSGRDELLGGDGQDTLRGGSGDDTLDGGAGNDRLHGGSGDDTLIASGGDDALYGGANNDTFDFTNAQDGDVYTVSGGGGRQDTIDLSAYSSDQVSFSEGRIDVALDDGGSFAIHHAGVEQVQVGDETMDLDSPRESGNVNNDRVLDDIDVGSPESGDVDDDVDPAPQANEDGGDEESDNAAPIADAGEDQVVRPGDEVRLDGSDSFDWDDGDTLQYEWTQVRGPEVALNGADTATPTFVAPEVDAPTTMEFELRVSDAEDSRSDGVAVSVQIVAQPSEQAGESGGGGSAPVAEDVPTDAAEAPTDDGAAPAPEWFAADGAADFAELASAYEDFVGESDAQVTFGELGAGAKLGDQFVESHGVKFTNTAGGRYHAYSGAQTEGGAIAEHITGYDGSYMPDGDKVYVKFDNDNPDTPFTMEFEEPVSSVGAMIGMGVQGDTHSVQVSLYNADGEMIDQQVVEAQLWEANSSKQNYEGFFAVKLDEPAISKVEIVNLAHNNFANALIIDNVAFSHDVAPLNSAPDALDDVATTTGSTLVSEDFSDGVDDWGAEVSASDGRMLIQQDETASKVFDFGAEHANQTVVVEFDVTTAGTWDRAGSLKDSFNVVANGENVASDSYAGGQSAHYRLEVQADADGQVSLELNADTTGSDEVVYVDNFQITRGDDWQDAIQTAEDTPLTLEASDLLANDTDADGDTLTITSVQDAEHGSVTLNSDGTITFTPDADYHGPASFTYTVDDGHGGTDTATVALTVNAADDIPVADAGADQVVNEGDVVQLAGSATDADGDALSYQWVQTSGPKVQLSDPSAANPTFEAPEGLSNTDVTFELHASDGTSTSVDTVTVTVNADNDAPTAEAGADQVVEEGDVVQLAGSGTDPEGQDLSYEWVQTSGPKVRLSDPSVANPTFEAPEHVVNTDVTFELRVSDGTTTSVDTVAVHINADNDAPRVDAGADQVVNEGDVVQLRGQATDPEAGLVGGAAAGLEYTFDDGNLDDWSSTRGEWGISDGHLENVGGGEHRLWLNESPGENFEVALRAKMDQGNGFGVWIAESTDPVDGYSVQFDPGYGPDGQLLLRRWENNRESVVEAVDFDGDWYGVEHDFQIRVENDTISLSIDGKDCFEVEHAEFDHSHVGLRTWSSTDLSVDEFAVRPLDAVEVPPVSYEWVQTGGPKVVLSDATTAEPTFTAPEGLSNSDVTFELRASDGENTSVDTVTVTINADNDAPAAEAGPDQVVNEGDVVQLAGSGTDPEGQQLSYQWVQTSGPKVQLSDPQAANPTFTAPEQIANTDVAFELHVSDGENTSVDTVTVTINADNDAPVAEAGPDQVVEEGAVVTLDATGSSDVDSGGAPPAAVTFDGDEIDSYGGHSQDRDLGVAVEDGGATLHLTGNGWKSIDMPYQVTENTILEFDFKSDAEGEIHGIGFDTDEGISANRTFKVHGTQRWGIGDYDSYRSEDGWTHYRIPVGEHFTGDFDRLTFTNDHDVRSPDAESMFSNVRVYEAGDVGQLQYEWVQTGGPKVVLDDPHAAKPSFTAPEGLSNSDVSFELRVSDGHSTSVDNVTVTINADNDAPAADAGHAQVVNENELVQLGGSGVDPEGEALTYEWVQTGGPKVRLDNPTSPTPTFKAPEGLANTDLKFELHVSDGTNVSVDAVSITVNADNDAPAAEAGTDLVVDEGDAVRLAGSATDPEGQDLTYQWVQTGGPRVALHDANTPEPTFTAPEGLSNTELTFELQVSDGETTSVDSVRVTVHADNDAPAAEAGADLVVDEGDVVQLAGSAHDAEGQDLSYEWVQISGPRVRLDDASTLTPSFTAPEGLSNTELSFELRVSDGENTSVSTVDVLVSADNDAPVAESGPDLVVSENDVVTLTGSATDPEGQGLTYEWTQTGGPRVILDDPTAATPTFTAPEGLVNTELTFELRASDGERVAVDSVAVVVEADNDAPSADAGVSQFVNENEPVQLGGVAHDAEGQALSYEWVQTGGPRVFLNEPNTPNPTFIAPERLTNTDLTFELHVSDGENTSVDSVVVTVGADDDAPVANAGADQTATAGAEVVLAAEVHDPEQQALQFEWVQTDGPAVSLSDRTSPNATFTAPEVDEAAWVTLELRVTDGSNTSVSTVNIAVQPTPTAPAEASPVDAAAPVGEAVTGAGTSTPEADPASDAVPTAMESPVNETPDAAAASESGDDDAGAEGAEPRRGVSHTPESFETGNAERIQWDGTEDLGVLDPTAEFAGQYEVDSSAAPAPELELPSEADEVQAAAEPPDALGREFTLEPLPSEGDPLTLPPEVAGQSFDAVFSALSEDDSADDDDSAPLAEGDAASRSGRPIAADDAGDADVRLERAAGDPAVTEEQPESATSPRESIWAALWGLLRGSGGARERADDAARQADRERRS